MIGGNSRGDGMTPRLLSVTAKAALQAGVAILALAVVACAGALAWMRLAPRHVPTGQPPLATLGAGSLSVFRSAFNAADGEVRVLVMLSPT